MTFSIFPSAKGIKPLTALTQEAMVIDFLTLGHYHDICRFHLSQYRDFFPSALKTLSLGALMFFPSGDRRGDGVEIALLAAAEFRPERWQKTRRAAGEMMENGWTRYYYFLCMRISSQIFCSASYNSDEIVDTGVNFCIRVSSSNPTSWLSQANYIFSRLQVTSNFDDYVVLHDIFFDLIISAPTANLSKGFLFVCPIKDFQTGAASFRWPTCPAYWSLDPSGKEHLSTDEATHFGFPSLQYKIEVGGFSWDPSVYAGLRQFHQGKGFDPDSQDVARHLGQPLYRLPGEVDGLFARVDEEDSTKDDDQSCATAEDESENEPEKSGANHVDDEDPSAENDESAGGTKSEHGDALKKSGESQDTSTEDSDLHEEIPLSWTFKLFMNVQLALIVFLALSWVYRQSVFFS
ncbi:hypothetical protein B0H19DRAFT_85671 [Mycena capillaripes]|nr:hypothetical protein B0H19DRAFT_85671 [Mycena capillaripes]